MSGWLAGRLPGERYRVLADGRSSGGAFGAVEIVAMPGGRAPLHRHAAEDELLHLLEGALAVEAEGIRTTLAPGGTAFVPRGTPHAFATAGGEPARFLALYTPAGPERWFSDAFAAADAPARPLAEVLARMRAAGARHGIEWLE